MWEVEIKRQISIRFLKRHSTRLELGSGQNIAYWSNLLDTDEDGLRCLAKLQRQMDENDGVPYYLPLSNISSSLSHSTVAQEKPACIPIRQIYVVR